MVPKNKEVFQKKKKRWGHIKEIQGLVKLREISMATAGTIRARK